MVDGNTRHAKHNIYKSDVFSSGLVFFQLASMDDVTGFNQKNHVNDGEKLTEQGLKSLRSRYSEHICEILRLMLRFDENERPSFVELAKLVLTSAENTLESPKPNGSIEPAKASLACRPAPHKAIEAAAKSQNEGAVAHTGHASRVAAGSSKTDLTSTQRADSNANLMTQAELFKNYVESNHLYMKHTPEVF